MKLGWFKSKGFLTPTLFLAAFVLLNLALLGSGHRKYDNLERTLIQWDGQLYLSIARDGYEKFPCPDNPDNICGNAGWFPLYPLVAAAVGRLGVPIPTAMILVSCLALWLGMLLLFRVLSARWDSRVATVALVAMLLFPGSFYYLTAFPYALYFLLGAWLFRMIARNALRWLWLPAALLAVTYPSGVVAALPILWLLIVDWRRSDRPRRRHLIAALVAIPLAMTIYFGYYWWRFNDFWLYLHIQSQSYYAHEPAFPLWTIARSLVELPHNSGTFISLVFTLAVVVLFFSRRLPLLWHLFMFGVLLFTPTLGTTTCYYRHVIVAFPLPVMIALATRGSWRRWLLLPLAVACVLLNLLVYLPMYKSGLLM